VTLIITFGIIFCGLKGDDLQFGNAIYWSLTNTGTNKTKINAVSIGTVYGNRYSSANNEYQVTFLIQP